MEEVSKAINLVKDVSDGSTLKFVVCIVVLAILLFASIAKTLEILHKIFSGLWKGGSLIFTRMRGGRELREHVERRRQFLQVIASDLATIGKAEAWNDQFFTDLEAEVQIEGGYYLGKFQKLFGRKSFGQRREKSLIGAIDKSTERCLLLMGDPGAGKSVALRHLASQMIERAKHSKKKYSPIPLYINLREFNSSFGSALTVDSVKSFVIDNVRRGDADTAEYLKHNWSEFQEKGGWFFLFDSFDEIPAVMHATNEAAAVLSYGKAIQQFMDGLGSCRGVLASREYKSPGSLAWPKLKIMQLSEAKQEELVRRTFLTEDQKIIALRAISTSSSSVYKNPLFLTLLCRYVKENSKQPKNEHHLLHGHVKSLANRDTTYVLEKWGLSPAQLLEGASLLSRLFATQSELGLAPTIEEVIAAASRENEYMNSIQSVPSLIEALIYVKIGRTDVANSDYSARRFAFSHRRYQESLFASYIAENSSIIDPKFLLLDSRWREYLVAMLQVSDQKLLSSVIRSAAEIIDERVRLVKLRREKILGYEVSRCDWDDPVLEHILEIFVDVKRFNSHENWNEVATAVEKLFSPLWANGDLYDRLKVTQYSGIASDSKISSRLEFSMRTDISSMQEVAIDSCKFVVAPSDKFANWVRNEVANKIVSSRSRFELLKWDAVAAQLPDAYKIANCLSRAKSLSRFSAFTRIISSPFELADRVVTRVTPARAGQSGLGLRIQNGRRIGLMRSTYLLLVILGAGLGISYQATDSSYLFFNLVLVIPFGFVSIYLIRLIFLSEPDRLGVSFLFKELGKSGRSWHRDFLIFGIVVVIASIPGVVFWAFCRWLEYFSDKSYVDLIFTGSVSVFAILGAFLFVLMKFQDRTDERRAKTLLAEHGTLRKAIPNAKSLEAINLCAIAVARTDSDAYDLRRSVSYLSEVFLCRSKRRKDRDKVSRFDDSYVSASIAGLSILLDDLRTKASG